MQGKTKNQDIVSEIARDPAYLENLLYVISTKSFYVYDGRYYRLKSDDSMEQAVYRYIMEQHPDVNITSTYTIDLVKQLRWQCYRRIDEIETPYISLLDCLLNTDDFTYKEHNRNDIAIHFINISKLDVEKDECPQFKKFLSEIMVHKDLTSDNELCSFTQEMFGYYLMNTLKAHAMFFLVGAGANGKSVLLKILTALIGKDNCTHKSIQSLTTNQFACGGLVGKKLNVCNEEESKFLRADKFKALISGDAIDVDRKFKESISFVPKTKYIFATNEMPTFEGVNLGLRRRIRITPFYKSFTENEQDVDLIDKLMDELPGIMAWAIKGGKRLIENNFKLSQPMAVQDTMEEFVQGISSALLFFSEYYEINDKVQTGKFQMYREYVDWCVQNGRKSMNSSNFYKDIRSTTGGIMESRIRIDGKLDRSFNVSHKSDAQMPVAFELDSTDTIHIDSLKF